MCACALLSRLFPVTGHRKALDVVPWAAQWVLVCFVYGGGCVLLLLLSRFSRGIPQAGALEWVAVAFSSA